LPSTSSFGNLHNQRVSWRRALHVKWAVVAWLGGENGVASRDHSAMTITKMFRRLRLE
jgi:hypothetical protein